MDGKSRIRELIEARLEAVKTEERDLKQALAELEGKRRPGRPRKV